MAFWGDDFPRARKVKPWGRADSDSEGIAIAIHNSCFRAHLCSKDGGAICSKHRIESIQMRVSLLEKVCVGQQTDPVCDCHNDVLWIRDIYFPDEKHFNVGKSGSTKVAPDFFHPNWQI